MTENVPATDPVEQDRDLPQPEFLDTGRPSEDEDDQVDPTAGPAH